MIRLVHHSLLSIVGAVPVWNAPASTLLVSHASTMVMRVMVPIPDQTPRQRPDPSPLERLIAIDLRATTLHQALDTIQARGAIELNFVPSQIDRVTTRVTLSDAHITVRRAIDRALAGTALHATVTSTGQVVITQDGSAVSHPVEQNARLEVGAIHGRVVDALNARPLRFARVTLDDARTTTASDSGKYRFDDVTPTAHTVSAHLLGYSPTQQVAQVGGSQDVEVDLRLTKSASQLDRVVVAGTVVPTEVKAVPSPVSVVTDSEIALQRPEDIKQIFREAVPSAVAWESPAFPNTTIMSVRGATTLNFGDGQMKVYVDGIELADRLVAVIDPASIARIEVIRGPQAATLYGSAAIDGVMLITTKRGSLGLGRPELSLEAAGGVVQSPYGNVGGGNAARQSYKGSVAGGSQNASYTLGGSYVSTGDWAPESGTSLPSVYGGVHFAQGAFALDISGRDFVQHYGSANNPLLASTGFLPYTKPQHLFTTSQEQTYGANLVYTPRDWLRSTLTLGVDHIGIDARQTQPALTTPADTFRTISETDENKTSVGFNTSLILPANHVISGNITVGVDHYDLGNNLYFASGATTISGPILTDPNQPIGASRDPVRNTGYFAQAQVGLYDQLFATIGVRAEQNSDFGQDIGTPILPRFGLSYAPPIGGGIVAKVRASYGEAIRPPDASERDGLNSPFEIQLANPHLQPEDQRGWDAGIDIVSSHGWSVGVTYYDQTARGLIQQVEIPDTSAVPILQFQNLGRVRNSGVELEAKFAVSIAQLSVNYAYTSSRVESLGPLYAGDLRVGDQVLLVPRLTGGATLTIQPLSGTSIAVGAAYVGSWTYYNYFAEFPCFAGTVPCAASTRAYWEQYPGFVKVNLSITQAITPRIGAFVSVNNIGNNYAYEFSNASSVVGRTTIAGLRCRF
jgi:outer membrane receptor protein involved in Fe transport